MSRKRDVMEIFVTFLSNQTGHDRVADIHILIWYEGILMKLFVLAAAALAITTANAGADPLADRQANMKERGAIMRVLGPILQGKADFNADVVAQELAKLEANTKAGSDLETLWPQGSDAGETKAAPAVWSDFDGFKAANEKYEANVAAAVAAKPQDLAAFQAAFGPVAAGCGSCHETFRNK